MKKGILTLMCLLAMMATSLCVNAQEVTITLMPGWNWISVPLMDTLNFQTAMGTVTPVDGDIIKSHWGSAFYSNGQWRGTISQFYPGYGYHYKSNRTEPVIVTFNAQQPVPQVVVTTSEPTDITSASAIVGGTVTLDEGNHVYACGVCWDTVQMPAVNGNHTSNDANAGAFTDTLTELTPNTTYYLRAYVVTDYGLAYSEEQSFTTLDDGNSGNHEYVDLGLPSGTLWATCNVGANAPEECGDYFAWGETLPKNTYTWSNYQYCNGSYNTLTKYCNNGNYGYNGFTDNLTTLQPNDDAATINWGDGARTPTIEEWQELYNHCASVWTTRNGTNGRLFTASNGNSVFLPAVGFRGDEGAPYDVGNYGYYWSSSILLNGPHSAWYFYFNSPYYDVHYSNRKSGRSVRPVRSSSQSTSLIINNATINPMEDGNLYHSVQMVVE